MDGPTYTHMCPWKDAGTWTNEQRQMDNRMDSRGHRYMNKRMNALDANLHS